jgi:hypothetical protein
MLGNWSVRADAPGDSLYVAISVQHPTLGNYFTAALHAKLVGQTSNSVRLATFFWLMPHKVAAWIYWEASVLFFFPFLNPCSCCCMFHIAPINAIRSSHDLYQIINICITAADSPTKSKKIAIFSTDYHEKYFDATQSCCMDILGGTCPVFSFSELMLMLFHVSYSSDKCNTKFSCFVSEGSCKRTSSPGH